MIAERELSMDERVVSFREATDDVERAVQLLRSATLKLVDADLVGSVDLASPVLFGLNRLRTQLELQFGLFSAEAEESRLSSDGLSAKSPRLDADENQASAVTSDGSPLSLSRRYKGRRFGIPVNAQRIRQARIDAGLSLEQVADGRVSRVLIHLVERGRTRPSIETLLLIAQKTRKPIGYFTEAAQ